MTDAVSSKVATSTSSTAGSIDFSLMEEEEGLLIGANAVAVEIAARVITVRIILRVTGDVVCLWRLN